MIRALSATLLIVLLCCAPAKAQTGQVINCPLVDTTTFGSGSLGAAGNAVISNCLFVLPPTAMAYFFVQGTVACGAASNSNIRLDVILGDQVTYQNYGASFNGQITGSVLTVNSMITSPPFVIRPTGVAAQQQRLYDAFSGAKIPMVSNDTAVWIVSQATSTEPGGVFGGRGTYNLNTSVATPVAAETMWALPPVPAARVTESNTYEQLQCGNGTTVIESFAGGLPSGDQGPQGSIKWVQVEILSEIIGGLPPLSASITNGQVFIVMPSMAQGGFAP